MRGIQTLSLDKLVVLIVHVRDTGRMSLNLGPAPALLRWSQAHALAIVVEDFVLILDQLDGLALLKLFHRLGKRNVEDLAAMRRGALGVKRVHDSGIGGRRRGDVVVVGGRAGRLVGDGRAFEYVLLTGYLVAGLDGGYSAFLRLAPVVVETSARQLWVSVTRITQRLYLSEGR